MPNENYSNVLPIKGSYVPFTANTQLKGGAGLLHSIIVNSHTSGTFRLYNGLTAVTPIGGTYTPVAGSSVIAFDPPIDFNTGIYVVTGGTIDATALVN